MLCDTPVFTIGNQENRTPLWKSTDWQAVEYWENISDDSSRHAVGRVGRIATFTYLHWYMVYNDGGEMQKFSKMWYIDIKHNLSFAKALSAWKGFFVIEKEK